MRVVPLTNAVCKSVSSRRTKEPATKFVPLTVRLMSVDEPLITDAGEIAVMAGTGLPWETVTV